MVGCRFERIYDDRAVPKPLQGSVLPICCLSWSRIMMSWRMTAGEVANRAPLLEQDTKRLVVLWLLVMAALVAIMVVIGGSRA